VPPLAAGAHARALVGNVFLVAPIIYLWLRDAAWDQPEPLAAAGGPMRARAAHDHHKEQHRMRLRGTNDADQLHGAARDDTITGRGGDDLITGEGGGDRLLGGGGNDQLSGDGLAWSSSSASMPGAAGDDTLDGGAGADQLYGGEGDDLLLGGAGGDNLYGGAGEDTYEGGTGDDWYVDDADNYAYPVPVPAPAPGAPAAADLVATSPLPPPWPPSSAPPDADAFVFEAVGRGNFGHDQVSGFDPGADQLRFAGYTEADLASPVQTTVTNFSWDPDNPSYVTEWRFDFEDGSRVTVSFNDAGAHLDESGVLAGTAPVAGQDYVFV
jgi:Ca2+-binding RTX toxin-like protein